MLVRKTPLRRSGFVKRSRTRIRRATPERAREGRSYSALKADYLAAHPLCQITIARLGLDEAEVVACAGGLPITGSGSTYYNGVRIPCSNQIHHRNKRDGDRLCDVRFWLAASSEPHDLVEEHKDWARDCGLLLPINADKEGRMPDGCEQPLQTPEFMASRVGRPIPDLIPF